MAPLQRGSLTGAVDLVLLDAALASEEIGRVVAAARRGQAAVHGTARRYRGRCAVPDRCARRKAVAPRAG